MAGVYPSSQPRRERNCIRGPGLERACCPGTRARAPTPTRDQEATWQERASSRSSSVNASSEKPRRPPSSGNGASSALRRRNRPTRSPRKRTWRIRSRTRGAGIRAVAAGWADRACSARRSRAATDARRTFDPACRSGPSRRGPRSSAPVPARRSRGSRASACRPSPADRWP